jgi:hypothetical protein
VIVSLTLLSLFSLFFVRRHYSEFHRSQFREAAFQLVDGGYDRQGVLVTASAWNTAYFDYYLERLGASIRVSTLAAGLEDMPGLVALVGSNEPETLVLLWGHLEPDEALVDSLTGMFRLVEQEDFVCAGFYAFRVGDLTSL